MTTLFRYSRRLHHHETDSDGVCHFSNYFRIFEEAFSDALRSAQIPHEELPHALAITDARASYRMPLRHGDEFDVAITFPSVRRASLVADAVIRRDDTVCAAITATFAAINRSSSVSIALDGKLRRILTGERKEQLMEHEQ
jgi:YbgC/YbaW family acyl-CoA thioester hydrolase